MYVKRLKVENFRGIKDADVEFKPGLNILIGQNNTGKTALLNAIDLVLNPLIQWWRRDYLIEFDFWRCKTDQNINIELVLGCGRASCVIGDDKCEFYEMEEDEQVFNCPIAQYSLFVDNAANRDNYLTYDNINDAEDPENVIRLLFIATYNDQDGFSEVEHSILNEDGDKLEILSKSLKEFIGCSFLPAGRDPVSEMRLHGNSLLRRLLGDINSWKKDITQAFKGSLDPIVKNLTNTRAKELCKVLTDATNDININDGSNIGLGVGELRSNDLLRQIELCLEVDDNGSKWIVPFSRQGRGLQNISFLILGISRTSEDAKSNSILLLEEVEQNLEPQLQRNIISLAKKLSKTGTQLILTTHSPYVLSAILNLEGVQRLFLNKDGTLTSKNLHDIKSGRNGFIQLRKKATHDIELLESLFTRLVVVWEGDCEAGLYNALMRAKDDYPAEWLCGISGGDGGKDILPPWFKNAGYEVVVVLDGDDESALKKLNDDKIPFIALPKGMAIEAAVSEVLSNIEPKIQVGILLDSVGVTGEISFNAKLQKVWPALYGIFKTVNGCSGPLETALAKAEYDKLGVYEIPSNVVAFLKDFKKRRIYEHLGQELSKHIQDLSILDLVIASLEDLWRGKIHLNQHQIDANTCTVKPWEMA